MNRRSSRVGAAVVTVLLVVAMASCSQSGVGSGGSGDLTVETSSMWVTVGNKAGMPVTNITVEIIPVGGATVYTANLYRLEGGNKHDFPVNTFRGRDGTPFNLRVARPKAVRVTCTGVDGKPRETQVPWK